MKKISKEEAIRIQKDAKTDPNSLEHAPTRNDQFARSIDTINRLRGYFIGNVADIGCEQGHGSLELKKLGFNVTAVDLIDSCVEKTRESGIVTIMAPMEDLPFKDKEFDTGLYSHVLEHSYDFEKAISEAKRVFRRLIIVVPINDPYNIPCHTSRIDNEAIIKNNFDGNVLLETCWYRLHWKDANGVDTKEFVYVIDLE